MGELVNLAVGEDAQFLDVSELRAIADLIEAVADAERRGIGIVTITLIDSNGDTLGGIARQGEDYVFVPATTPVVEAES